MANFGDERLPESFWSKVQPEPNSGCWLWLASTCHGYGKIWLDGVMHSAHRLTYQRFIGNIPQGLQIDHRQCRTPLCCNPLHLEAVTLKENSRRSTCPSALNAKKTHCKRGHAFDERNTYHGKDGRSCRRCHADRVKLAKDKERRERLTYAMGF